MRRLTGLLLMLNLGALLAGALMTFWPGGQGAPADINSDKIRLLGVADPVKPATAAPVEPSAPAVPAPDAAAAPGCLTWNSYPQAVHERLERGLKTVSLAGAEYEIRLNAAKGWWAFIPPEADAATAKKTLRELKARKIKGASIVRGGALQHAVSLGNFADLKSARAQVGMVAGKGIKGALAGPRPVELKAVLRFGAPQDGKALRKLAQETGAELAAPSACKAE
ncbi:MAG: hypothetical protein HZB71_03640 [Betaproteobacteria bacterium]|nr:hypothetical protein [Betaproteobacteria bacterium]